MKLKYIITGTGRCGTSYIANAFNSIGVSCGHEEIFNLTLRPNKKSRIAECSWFAAAYTQNPIFTDCTIIHLVRKPLDVLRSWLFDYSNMFCVNGDSERSEAKKKNDAFIYAKLERLHDLKSPIDRALSFYNSWNTSLICDKDFRYLLHHVEDGAAKLFDKLEIKYDSKKVYSNTKCNSRRKCLLTNEEILSLISGSKFFPSFISITDELGYKLYA